MQGHRGKMVSLPETFEIDRSSSSSSSSAALDQQLQWNDLRTPPETLMLPPNDSFTFMNQNASMNNSWNFGESSSSSSAPFGNIDSKSKSVWPSSIRQGLRIEDQLYDPTPDNNMFSFGAINTNPLCPQGSGSSINVGQDHSSARGYVREGSSGDNRRMPCKRKSHEGAEVSEWHSSSSVPPFTEQIDPRLGLGLTTPTPSETSQTNFQFRVNNSSSSQRPQFTTAPVSQSQTLHSLFHAPLLPQLGQWASSSVPRNPVLNLGSPVRNETCNPRNNEENPLFVPPPLELRALAQNSAFPINVGSSPAVPQLSHQSRYHRRLFEHAHRQGMSSASLKGQSSSSSQPPFLQQVEFPSGPSNLDHHHHRSGIWMERQANTGLPYSIRSGFPSEGRRRLASEIRSVLEMVRRGDPLRFEDVMMLDPSMLFGVPHDRHRDMRLDVDNMSYEELLALEEHIGNVGTGLNQESILIHMKQRKYTKPAYVEAEVEPCCICQEDYNDGEEIGTLDCGHDFHRDCIKQWLTHKNLCPICKTTGLANT